MIMNAYRRTNRVRWATAPPAALNMRSRVYQSGSEAWTIQFGYPKNPALRRAAFTHRYHGVLQDTTNPQTSPTITGNDRYQTGQGEPCML